MKDRGMEAAGKLKDKAKEMAPSKRDVVGAAEQAKQHAGKAVEIAKDMAPS